MPICYVADTVSLPYNLICKYSVLFASKSELVRSLLYLAWSVVCQFRSDCCERYSLHTASCSPALIGCVGKSRYTQLQMNSLELMIDVRVHQRCISDCSGHQHYGRLCVCKYTHNFYDNQITKMAVSRAHPSAKATDVTKLLLLNKPYVTHPPLQSMAVPPTQL